MNVNSIKDHYTQQHKSVLSTNKEYSNKKSICQKFLSKLKRIQSNENFQGVVETKVVASHTGGILTNISNAGFLNAIFSAFKSSASAASSNDTGSRFKQEVLKYTRLAGILAAPAPLYVISVECYAAIAGPEKERINALLRATEGVSWAGDIATGFGRALRSAEMIAENQTHWIAPLVLVSAGLSLASAMLNAREWWKQNEFLNQIDNSLFSTKENQVEKTKQCYKKALRMLLKEKDENYLQKRFAINNPNLKKEIQNVLNASRTQKKALKEAVNALKDRVKSRITSNKLAIVTSIIGVIGIAILLLSPLAPVAYSIMAIGSVISLVSYLQQRRSAKRLEAVFKKYRPPIDVAAAASAGTLRQRHRLGRWSGGIGRNVAAA